MPRRTLASLRLAFIAAPVSAARLFWKAVSISSRDRLFRLPEPLGVTSPFAPRNRLRRTVASVPLASFSQPWQNPFYFALGDLG